MGANALLSKSFRCCQLKFVLLLLVALNNQIGTSCAAKILAIFPYGSVVRNSFILPYIRALSTNGHEVTVINDFEAEEKIPNTTFISIGKLQNIYEDFDDTEVAAMFTKWHESILIANYSYKISKAVLNNQEVQQLIRSSNKYDLCITKVDFVDALFGFAQHFQAPLVGISSFRSSWIIDFLAGNAAPSYFEPLSTYGYTNEQSIMTRLRNWIFITEERLLDQLVYLPRQEELYQEYFPNATMPFHQIRRNFSIILLNQHFSIWQPRPNVPNIIEIGGMHIPEATKPLPADLAAFVNDATYGVIYFSMGYDIKNKYLPRDAIDVLVRTFGYLKQRVIWKYEEDQLPNKTDNIYISKWLPQMDLLAHPNVKLFISHAGRFSMIETVYYGKPVLGLPVFYDQFENIERMKKSGVALSLNVYNLTIETLTSNINELLQNQSYTLKVRTLSKRFRDQQISPLQNAIWWTEYVLRHDGAMHMRVDEQNLTFFQYYRLDSITVILARLGITAFLVIYAARKICQFLKKITH